MKFHLELPQPIELNAVFTIPTDELKHAGIQELLPSAKVKIGLQLKNIHTDFEYMVTKFEFANGFEVTQSTANSEQEIYTRRLAGFLAQNSENGKKTSDLR